MSQDASAAEPAGATESPNVRQLVRLALVSGVPFVGFGIADNGIMILAGDYIDGTLGVKFGLSTLAAAGLGNLISDVAGIGIGEMIEVGVANLGLTAPPLTAAQSALAVTRFTKAGANVFGISLGCLIGMFPLLFMHDRKSVYFDDDELALFQNQFASYGVSPSQFFALVQSGTWRTAEVGSKLIKQGEVLDKVYLIHRGSAEAYTTHADGRRELVHIYSGKTATPVEAPPGTEEPDSLVRRSPAEPKQVPKE